MKLKNIFISLATVFAVLYLGLMDVSGRVTKAGEKAPVNVIATDTETWVCELIDGECCLVLYDADGVKVTVIPASTRDCD